MRNIFLLLLPIAFLVSCYHDQAEEMSFDMEKVIPAKKMTELFTDIQLMDGIIIQEQRNNKDPKGLANKLFSEILEKHQLTQEDFDESMRYYTYHTAQLNKIYEQVITNLSKMESEISMGTKSTDPD